MKRIAALFLLLCAVTLSSRAQTADDQYVIIYGFIQQADTVANSGQPTEALEKYKAVLTDLQKFQKAFPDWNPKIVNYRLSYLAGKIDDLTPQTLATNAPNASASAPVAANTNDGMEAQLEALHQQVKQLQVDNDTLQSKLKEALSTQPATVDVARFNQAQEQIRSLMKENELLKVSLGANKSSGGDMASVQQALTEANQKLAEQMERAGRLESENQALKAQVQSLTANADAAEALRQENEVLKKQLADVKNGVPVTTAAGDVVLSKQLLDAKAQITQLQSEAQTHWVEKLALENRVHQLQSTAMQPVSPSQVEYEARIRELEKERDDLLLKLGEANKKNLNSKERNTQAKMDELAQQVETLRSRIAVDEAQSIPYSPEELALLQKPEPHLAANPDAEKKSIKDLPGGTAVLVAEAQRHFASGEFDAAEEDYMKILEHDQNNGLALANLATIELEQGKLDEADKHITAAVAQSPNDAYNLSILGNLKFRQGKYDDAIDALSRAAKLSPQNPEIFNYLGVTLGHKGLRAQAETALRKAIQLDPNYGPAHNNLAVIYVSQQPPLLGLARWHYQKALDAGQPRNPDLENVLNGKNGNTDAAPSASTNAPPAGTP